MVKSISVQELRLHLPKIIEDLKHGVRFLLIYRSKPVGELKPLGDISGADLSDDPLKFFAFPSPPIKKIKKSVVKIIREERD